MSNLVLSEYRAESHSSGAAFSVRRIRHWMVGAGVSAGAIAAGALVAFTVTPTAHAEGEISDYLPGTSTVITPGDIVSVGNTLLTQLKTDATDAASTGFTNYLQDEATTAGSLAWLGAQSTHLVINSETATDPAEYLFAGETGTIINAEKAFLNDIVLDFNGVQLPESYDNSTLDTAFNQDVQYALDIYSTILGNSQEIGVGLASEGILSNVRNSQLVPLASDTLSMLGFNSDLYHEALWTVDVAALAGLF
jgi:hypothetical protein